MSLPPRPERATQDRVVALFCGPGAPGCLGYRYLGNWQDRAGNRCIEELLLRANLEDRGYGPLQVSGAIEALKRAADPTGGTLYQANMAVYRLLRYGVPVSLAPGQPFETVHLVDWDNPDSNDFALAEEVTLQGGYERRPDLVLYVNGIALVVVELKRASVEVADGVAQLCTNQEPIFSEQFFATAQLLLAGSDSQGLRYGTVGTPAQYYVQWKPSLAPGEPLSPGALLDRPLAELCRKEQLLDLVRNFVLFDAGIKKVPRQHQYAAIKAAQERIRRREGGVIWHTQGSGKSLLMVLLAKWILENEPDARILVITDRDELDRQIEGVMRNAGVIGEDSPPPRITSRQEFVARLGAASPRLLCALLHKFDVDPKAPAPAVTGHFYVFVDECHRTQGGDMHKQMKSWLEGAVFIGFTGTPLLRNDRKTTRQVFGTYIHTYKFNEAVADRVVLDLTYEARRIDQSLLDATAIDQWFHQKTRGLNDFQRSVLRRKWATMEALMSSSERKRRIVADIIKDFAVVPRLRGGHGTAILVASSIHEACHYYRIFRESDFGKHCGLVTSFVPLPTAIATEPANSDERYKFDTYTKHVLGPNETTEAYEQRVKQMFIKEPANMKLLIVVSKLLTGFDAPSCSYIYLDNEIRDHTLFQAICRTNRLDGDDKITGHIVDYKGLFQHLQGAVAVYTDEDLDDDEGRGGGGPEIQDWLIAARKRLEAAIESMHYICEPVPQPRELEQYLRYFCGDPGDPNGLSATEKLRISYYKGASALLRAFAEIAGDLPEAGYTDAEVAAIVKQVQFYTEVRSAIKKHSGEELDTRPYEADMRHLINTYIGAGASQMAGDLGALTLTQLIAQDGAQAAVDKALPAQKRASRRSVAEAIINNLRKTIIQDHLKDPRYYKEMSLLLDDLIALQVKTNDEYETFLAKAEALARALAEGARQPGLPDVLQGRPEAIALYNNLPAVLAPGGAGDLTDDERAEMAGHLDTVVRDSAPAGWYGDTTRERQIARAVNGVLKDPEATRKVMEIIKAQPGYR